MGIDPDDITFIEDVWAGGGNLGPSIEYFVNGLELGNMVFMQYKTFPDGSREELPIRVIDVGIGLERVPWLINGTATSYQDVFRRSFEYLTEKLKIDLGSEIWNKLGPYSCQLNIDEVDDIDQTWQRIGGIINEDVNTIKKTISVVQDLYIILDHTRTVFITISDGSLPSNVGGGSNIRNILRRVFALLKKHNWWSVLGMEGLMELFELQKKDLAELYGAFPEYKSFQDIIRMEHEKWLNTDGIQKQKLEKLTKGKQEMTMEQWIVAVTSWGISPDMISSVIG